MEEGTKKGFPHFNFSFFPLFSFSFFFVTIKRKLIYSIRITNRTANCNCNWMNGKQEENKLKKCNKYTRKTILIYIILNYSDARYICRSGGGRRSVANPTNPTANPTRPPPTQIRDWWLTFQSNNDFPICYTSLPDVRDGMTEWNRNPFEDAKRKKSFR